MKKRMIKAAAGCLAAGCILWFWTIVQPKVKEELICEAGSEFPTISDFLLEEYADAEIDLDEEELPDMNQPGDYEIKIRIGRLAYQSLLHIVDTVAPLVKTKDVHGETGLELKPEDFIESIEDATETTVEFVTVPDTQKPGNQTVELLALDQGGNQTRMTAKLEIVEDKEPPVIQGVEPLAVGIGDSISYKRNVTVADNLDTDPELEVDDSAVNLNQSGEYPLVYIAKDESGNETEAKTTVQVVDEDAVGETTEEVQDKLAAVTEAADRLLEQIAPADMPSKDRAYAIFNWVHDNIRWKDGTPKTSWVDAAYLGLIERKGDCYAYASSAKCLLTRAGIPNMDIGFSNERRTHYWNLIDLGEGWYHFDATRRADGRSFFYCSDKEIREYSETHNGSHAYDPSLYPEIQ